MEHQQYIRQGFDSEQAKILAAMQPTIDAELARAAPPAHIADRTLTDLVQKYEEKWPQICYVKGGSRARKAMELVLSGQLHGLPDADGNDLWLIRGYRCSKKGGWCDCQDRVLCDPTYGKLCQHRLAVALKTNWLGDQHPALLEYVRRIIEESPESPCIDLLVERDYDWHNEGSCARVAGYWHHGMSQHKRVASGGDMPVTITQFQWVLAQVGYGLAELPKKLPGMTDYYYRIAKGEGLVIDDTIFYHKGRTWRMEDRERMRRFQLADLAASIDQWVNGVIKIDLSRYEAKRVFELNKRMQGEAVQAAEVWQNLPDALKNSILDQEGVQYAN